MKKIMIESEKPAPTNEIDREFIKMVFAANDYFGKNRDKMSGIEGFTFELKSRMVKVKEGWDPAVINMLKEIKENG